MVKSIFLFGEKGKTIIAYGILKKLILDGYKGCYFKPIAKARYRLPSLKYVDPDVIAVKDALGLQEPIEYLNPVTITRNIIELRRDLDNVKKMIMESYSKICEGRDVIVIEGYPNPEALSSIGLSSAELAKMLNAKAVFLVNVKERDVVDELADRIQLYKCFFEHQGYSLSGVILNNVPMYYIERVNDVIVPVLEEKGLNIYGIIPEKPSLTAPTVRDIVEALNAEVIENRDRLTNIVEDIVVGAMAPSAALRWFRRAVNAAIVTGGDRTDLIMAALETKPSVIILTGNLYPDISVLTKAREVGVPILLVPYDTYTTVEKLREVQSITTSDSLKAKESELIRTISENLNMKKLLE
ncbi:phosphotransacetylase family protein [Ignisphaera sp. 4213-co]|uniref:Phosphotransacetylase family protein n=1 Tax=Ignisphaera cupida TaxID=3050454 RepID=A0ABD4Z772_9CREN|nr:phosphotransacetylase family protein [Ignisphaera sp. 4213-co]MDK6028768.1 phosphotransacetylase family protein [Ignisphaera sp. 4213-co]